MARSSDRPRININIPEDRLERVRALARKRGQSVTEVVRYSLGLAEALEPEVSTGKRIAIVNDRGEVVGIIPLPL